MTLYLFFALNALLSEILFLFYSQQIQVFLHCCWCCCCNISIKNRSMVDFWNKLTKKTRSIYAYCRTNKYTFTINSISHKYLRKFVDLHGVREHVITEFWWWKEKKKFIFFAVHEKTIFCVIRLCVANRKHIFLFVI